MARNGLRNLRVKGLGWLVCALAIAAPCAGANSNKKVNSAVDRVLSIYIPQNDRDSRFYLTQMNANYAPGPALQDASLDVGKTYFRSAVLFDTKSELPFNAVLTIHPKWETKDKVSTLTIKYKLLDAAGATLTEGQKYEEINVQKLLFDNAFYATSLSLMREIIGDERIMEQFQGAANQRTATGTAFDRTLLVSREKPAKSGTGFYINEHGQVMTAAHVVHDCPVAEIKQEGKSTTAKVIAESLLLDLAVVDGGGASVHSIPLRTGNSFELGETVTNIGFPLDGVLAASPNVTRGNVSSRTALAGALGQFQFSAPVQPGSSGGPVISETGELLGVTVGTLGISGLIQRGVLPQNVNFALDARYVASFMDRNKVSFLSVASNRKSDGHSATEATIPAVVQLLCYQ